MDERSHGDYFGLVGAGGYGREVMPSFREQVDGLGARSHDQLCFLVEKHLIEVGSVNGMPVRDLEWFLQLPAARFFNVAIGDSRARMRIAQKCIDAGARPLSIIDRTARVLDNCEIGEGAILSPLTIVTSNAKIGRFFHANIYSYVAHDCVVGDYVTFAPGVKCNGNIVIHDHAYIGTGAVIKPGSSSEPLVIGEGAVVGMGAVVTKSVAPGAVVVGNPAVPLARKPSAS